VPRRYQYLLGDASWERARLRAQAALWDPVSHALFDRLRIRPGWRVLEIGPGSGSLHLELRRRVRRSVDAVEQSGVFASRLAARIRRDGFGAGRVWRSELSATALPPNHYDLIFARWVFLFLPEPEARVRQLVAALKPGGRLVLQDYHRETFGLVPRPPEWRRFMEADMAFFASQGGDASIGSRLPAIFRRAGLALADDVLHGGHAAVRLVPPIRPPRRGPAAPALAAGLAGSGGAVDCAGRAGRRRTQAPPAPHHEAMKS